MHFTRSSAMRLPVFRPRLRDVLVFLLSLCATAPAWIVRHPPLEDLPTHLAILRVVHSYSDPLYGLRDDFQLNLFHTQYLLYYVVGSFLAYVLGVVKANIALMCLYLGGTVVAMRDLLNALGKDERIAIFTLPLLVNVMFMFGFLPFLLGIPVCLFGLASAIRHIERPTRKTGVVLGVVALALFLLHVFPFVLFGIGFIALFPWTRPSEWVRAALPVVPAVALALFWTASSESAHASLGTLSNPSAGVAPPDASIQAAAQWSINIFRDSTDELYFVMAGVVALAAVGLAQGDRDRSKPPSRAYAVVPIVCVVLYFTTGEYVGDAWLFAQRFPVLALITAVPLLRMPAGGRGLLVTVAATAVGLGAVVNVCKHFIQFEREEVGDFDEALAQMAPARRVAGLIFDKASSVVHLAPFLHFVSYYQAEKGGVVQFSNANIRHSPFHFRPDRIPPQGQPARLRWEWTPESVRIEELFPYYDYVLTRGGGFRPPPGTFHMKWHGDRWAVWEKG
jgi:hypothetical protein